MPLLPPDITLGVEVELLAPRGTSRLDLAAALAARIGGSVRRGFHLDTEPSLVPGKPVFHNLTPAFITHGADGGWRYRCTDDLTLQDDLDRDRPPSTDWFRILSDDARILRLIARHVDPEADRVEVLRPVGALFGVRPEPLADGVVRLLDPAGQPLALVASLPGERERPCELVTSPTPAPELDATLRCGLDEARSLGFAAPAEGATHVHLDGRPLQDARALRRFVHLTEPVLPGLRFLLRTNPRCRRLGPWSPALRAAVDAPDFHDLPWTEACARLTTVGLSKYVDLNLKNIVHPSPDKTTIEWRTLPVSLDPDPILRAARLFVAVMARAVGDAPLDLRRVDATPRGVLAWLDQLSLDARDLRAWRGALPT
jgi:hypothetical protein